MGRGRRLPPAGKHNLAIRMLGAESLLHNIADRLVAALQVAADASDQAVAQPVDQQLKLSVIERQTIALLSNDVDE